MEAFQNITDDIMWWQLRYWFIGVYLISVDKILQQYHAVYIDILQGLKLL